MSADSSLSEDITVIDMNYFGLPHDVSTPSRTNSRCSALLPNLQNDETYVKLPFSTSCDNYLNHSTMSSQNLVPNIDRFIDPLSCMQFLPSNPDLNLS